MNQLFTNLGTALKNPHIRWSLLAAGLCEAGAIWFPAWKVQFQETQKLFGGYAVLVAANSTPQPPAVNPAPVQPASK